VAADSKWKQMAPIVFANWQKLDDLITDHKSASAGNTVPSSHNVKLHRARRQPNEERPS
jgi:DeoR/GlpR family transcriptional regulator of sugar metabolism